MAIPFLVPAIPGGLSSLFVGKGGVLID